MAIVLDDSPEREAEEVVRDLQDQRIRYQWNPTNLGAAGNLSQAFQSSSLLGAKYACVLEDDNWLLPKFLAENVRILEESQACILHRNQFIYSRASETPVPLEGTTLGNRFFRPGLMSPCELHAGAFFFPGVSNGALFWNTSTKSHLGIQIGVKDPSLQEYCRCIEINEASYFASEPLAVYADVPRQLTSRHYTTDRTFSRALQHIWREILRYHGPEVIEYAQGIANRTNASAILEKNVLSTINFSCPRSPVFTNRQRAVTVARGIVKAMFVHNPLDGYYPLSRPRNGKTEAPGVQ